MNESSMLQIKGMHLAPYIQLATALIGKIRHGGGNMFRHQMDTLAILIDYGYVDNILLKASLIHDLLEDIPEYDKNVILGVDEDSAEVLKLVLEVTRRPGETKPEFLGRVREKGSHNAKLLKVGDRVSNMISLGFVTDRSFVERYTAETEGYILPIALQVEPRMAIELKDLIASRRHFLRVCNF
jgi:(p)ppGpp synthase/HD superfamily hydrolase